MGGVVLFGQHAYESPGASCYDLWNTHGGGTWWKRTLTVISTVHGMENSPVDPNNDLFTAVDPSSTTCCRLCVLAVLFAATFVAVAVLCRCALPPVPLMFC